MTASGGDEGSDGWIDYYEADVRSLQNYYSFGMLMPGRMAYRGEDGLWTTAYCQRYSNPSTLNRILAAIKVYYDFLCAAEKRSDHPARSIVLRDQRSRDIQLQDLFTPHELELLLNHRERYGRLGYRNKVLMSLLINQGLHPQECAAVLASDVGVGAAQVFIRATPKNNSRTLALKAGQILLLQEYITVIRPGLLKGRTAPELLIGLRGKPMAAQDISKHVKRIYGGLYPGRQVAAQTIRQSVTANLLKQGHDLSVVRAFAGHKYPGPTEKYRQGEIENLQSAINQYHPLG